MGWPENTDTLKKFYPTSVMETAADIIFFWVARMMMFGLHFMDETPFHTVYFHALIRDKEGRKMSKTYGNVVDPLYLVYGVDPADVPEEERTAARLLFEDYPEGIQAQGADALRFTLCMYAAQGRDIRLDIRRVEGYRAFLNKIWQATRFVQMNTADLPRDAAPVIDATKLSVTDKWILERLAQAVDRVNQGLEDYRFNDAAQAIYDFLWNEYCDWYIELSKPVLYNKGEGPEVAQAKATTQAVLIHVLETVLRLLHPFAPFVSEEIWQQLPKASDAPATISHTRYPEALSARYPEAAKHTEQLIAIVQAMRNVRGEANVPPSKVAPKLFIFSDDAAISALLEATEPFIKALAKVESIELVATDSPRPKASATAMADTLELNIPLAGLIDIDEERQRLNKQLKKLDKDIAFVSKKLGNPRFVERAPAEVVEKEREKLAEYEEKRATLQAGLERLA